MKHLVLFLFAVVPLSACASSAAQTEVPASYREIAQAEPASRVNQLWSATNGGVRVHTFNDGMSVMCSDTDTIRSPRLLRRVLEARLLAHFARAQRSYVTSSHGVTTTRSSAVARGFMADFAENDDRVCVMARKPNIMSM